MFLIKLSTTVVTVNEVHAEYSPATQNLFGILGIILGLIVGGIVGYLSIYSALNKTNLIGQSEFETMGTRKMSPSSIFICIFVSLVFGTIGFLCLFVFDLGPTIKVFGCICIALVTLILIALVNQNK